MVTFEAVSKVFADGTEAVKELDLEVGEGEFVVLIGPSGCGKTTSLKMINRLEESTSGRIRVNGRDIRSVDPVQLRRGIGYVIQEIALWPHMSVAENIGIVPRLLGWHSGRIDARVDELLALAGLDPAKFRHRLPDQLSGGQKQRIGVLRALAADPPVVLMDEPFGALDPITRDVLQSELKELNKSLRKTIVFVTHDMDEALKLADRVVLMRQGKIEQMGSPEEIQNAPANDFVRSFIGEDRLASISPESSLETLLHDPFLRVAPGEDPRDVLERMEDDGLETAQVVDARGNWVGMLYLPVLKRTLRNGGTLRDAVRRNRKLIFEEAVIRDAAEMLADMDLSIPVVNRENVFLGVVTSGSLARLAIGRLSRSRKEAGA